jgi:Ca2+-dependent lipid-binding protein
MKWDSTKKLSKGLKLCIDCFDYDRGKSDELIGRYQFELEKVFDGVNVLKG